MKKFIIFALLSMTGMTMVYATNGQLQKQKAEQGITQQDVTEDEKVYSKVDEMPSFPTGEKAMKEWMKNNLKYPVVAEENGIQGTVVVKFVVRKNGMIDNINVVKSVDPSLDKEAKRLIRVMPRRKPGKQNGEPVNVEVTVPVYFSIE